MGVPNHPPPQAAQAAGMSSTRPGSAAHRMGCPQECSEMAPNHSAPDDYDWLIAPELEKPSRRSGSLNGPPLRDPLTEGMRSARTAQVGGRSWSR